MQTETAKVTTTHWYPDEKLIITHISGDVDIADVERWEKSLTTALGMVEDNGQFKILVNLYGFKALNLEAHKRFRSIIPLTLAEYGWKVGYIDMFEEDAGQLRYSNKRGIKCFAAAHCHQDSTKIEIYESRYSRPNEHFFTDPVKAEEWIRGNC